MGILRTDQRQDSGRRKGRLHDSKSDSGLPRNTSEKSVKTAASRRSRKEESELEVQVLFIDSCGVSFENF